MPIGVFGLGALMARSQETIGQVVGLIILISIGLQSLSGKRFERATSWPWMLITFGGSGLLQGLSGIGGPPMVLWTYSQNYTVDRARAFLFALYIANFIPQMLVLNIKFGSAIWNSAVLGLMATPFILAGADLGLRMGNKLGDRWLRPLVYTILVSLAGMLVVGPWLK
jgi:uncharacterized membrane protein YfcA